MSLSATSQPIESPPRSQAGSDAIEPPGGVLVWLVVFLEILTFGAGIGVFLHQAGKDAAAFEVSRNALNQSLALVNTLVLLTGGWFMANGLTALRRGCERAARRWIAAAMGSGLAFLLVKCVEYTDKIRHGIGFGEDVFSLSITR